MSGNTTDILRNKGKPYLIKPIDEKITQQIVDCIFSALKIVSKQDLNNIAIPAKETIFKVLTEGEEMRKSDNLILLGLISILTDARVIRQTFEEIKKKNIIMPDEIRETPEDLVCTMFNQIQTTIAHLQHNLGREIGKGMAKPLRKENIPVKQFESDKERLAQLKKLESFLIDKTNPNLFVGSAGWPIFHTVVEMEKAIEHAYETYRISSAAISYIFSGKTKKPSPKWAQAIRGIIKKWDYAEENKTLFLEHIKNIWWEPFVVAMYEAVLQEKN